MGRSVRGTGCRVECGWSSRREGTRCGRGSWLAYLAAECVGGGLAANHRPLLALLEQIRATTDVPMIGSGGVTTGRRAAAVLGAGAIAAQLGTALLCTPEAGTSALYRQALLDARFPDTILTRAYSGRFPEGWQTGSRSSTTGRLRKRTRRYITSPDRFAPPPQRLATPACPTSGPVPAGYRRPPTGRHDRPPHRHRNQVSRP